MFYELVRLSPILLTLAALGGLVWCYVIPNMKESARKIPLTKSEARRRMWMEIDMPDINDPFNKLMMVTLSVMRWLLNEYTFDSNTDIRLDDLLSVQIESWIHQYGAKYHIYNPSIKSRISAIVVDENGETHKSADDRTIVYCTIDTSALGIVEPGGRVDCVIDLTYPYTTKYKNEFDSLQITKRLINHMYKCALTDRSNSFIFRVTE